jgi:hypothetical protein
MFCRKRFKDDFCNADGSALPILIDPGNKSERLTPPLSTKNHGDLMKESSSLCSQLALKLASLMVAGQGKRFLRSFISSFILPALFGALMMIFNFNPKLKHEVWFSSLM